MAMTGDRKHDPIDDQDDIFSALAIHDDWYMQGDGGELIPISREQLAAALAWRRRVAERDRSRHHPEIAE